MTENKTKKLVRVYVSEESHRRVKQFAARKGVTLQYAYDFIIHDYLDEYGREKKGEVLTVS